MHRKGQMTLEIVIMMLMVIIIFSNISIPLGGISRAATESVGTAAFAAKTVDTLVNNANLVGISGDGAKDRASITLRDDFTGFSCPGGNSISMVFDISEDTYPIDPAPGSQLTLSLVPATTSSVSKTYSGNVDFPISCNLPGAPYNNENLDICFVNNAGTVSISTTCT